MDFLTHPWSLFFILVSVFSIGFSWYQRDRGTKNWALFYAPTIMLALTVPLTMMSGYVRSALAVLLAGSAFYQLSKTSKALDRKA